MSTDARQTLAVQLRKLADELEDETIRFKDSWYAVWETMATNNPNFASGPRNGLQSAVKEVERLYQLEHAVRELARLSEPSP
jgi:hypothetical protein